jgi:hypothetical protein
MPKDILREEQLGDFLENSPVLVKVSSVNFNYLGPGPG